MWDSFRSPAIRRWPREPHETAGPEINNNFSAVRHAAVFEGVKTATATGESIQKIISAPISFEEKVVGVMQISRKGGSLVSEGPDFTPEELGRVLAICKPLGKLVSLMAG